MRDHQPITIEDFNGLYKREATPDSCPPDHFSDCNNIEFGDSSFRTRTALDIYAAYANVVRIYTFNQESGQSLLVLDQSGNIYDTGSPTPFTPILSVSGMSDFGFAVVAGRAFISPSNGITGLENQYVYIYEGDGTAARVAAGAGPTSALSAANSATAGNVEAGIHIFAAVYERNSGALSNVSTGFALTTPGDKKVDLSSIPVSADPTVTTVHIVATKAIRADFYTGDTQGYEFFKVPGAEVTNGTTTLTVNFFDSELLESWNYLQDLFTQIPAGAGLSTYHNRLVVWATFDDPSVAYLSTVGEPEAINQVDGLIVYPLDGNPIKTMQEYRDVLYGFKDTQTRAWTDNGDEPSSWPTQIIDGGLGCSGVHCLALVLDSGSVNVDALLVANFSGLYLFNGSFITPELSWKIEYFWLNSIAREEFNDIQLFNDTINKKLWMALPDGTMLHANYKNGLTSKAIRFTPMTFDAFITSIALIDRDTLVLASIGERV